MSFLTFEAASRLGKENKLMKLANIIDWEKIGEKLKGLYAYEINGAGGQEPYDSLKMFKAILLGQWHALSDPELEESLKVRLDFLMFTGLETDVPDETTLCRFRNLLMQRGLYETLFARINQSLEAAGLKVRGCEGAVIDATIIESASRPRKTIEVMPEDRNETREETKTQGSISYAKDPDAGWLKKGRKSYFGYKGFVAVDAKDGYVEKTYVTPANESEVKQLEEIIPDAAPGRIYADKGYASKDNRDILRNKNIKDGIMEKANRDKPLTHWQKIKNRLISGKRFIVEQSFGTLKRRFKFERASYITRMKVEAQLILKAICFNLLKAINKVELIAGN